MCLLSFFSCWLVAYKKNCLLPLISNSVSWLTLIPTHNTPAVQRTHILISVFQPATALIHHGNSACYIVKWRDEEITVSAVFFGSVRWCQRFPCGTSCFVGKIRWAGRQSLISGARLPTASHTRKRERGVDRGDQRVWSWIKWTGALKVGVCSFAGLTVMRQMTQLKLHNNNPL